MLPDWEIGVVVNYLLTYCRCAGHFILVPSLYKVTSRSVCVPCQLFYAYLALAPASCIYVWSVKVL